MEFFLRNCCAEALFITYDLPCTQQTNRLTDKPSTVTLLVHECQSLIYVWRKVKIDYSVGIQPQADNNAMDNEVLSVNVDCPYQVIRHCSNYDSIWAIDE